MKKITRRDFIKKGALGIAGCVVTSGFKSGRIPCSTDRNHLKIIHITDSHMDLGRSETVKWVQMFVNRVNSSVPNVDFVLFGGDNFNNNVPEKKDAEKFRTIMNGLYCPWYSVRGNKESSPRPSDDPLNQRDYAEMFYTKDLEMHGKDWKLQKGNYVILGIDTTVPGHANGFFSKQSLDFVENELKSNPQLSYIILNHQVYHNFWGETDKKRIHKYVLNNVDEVKQRLFSYDNLLMTLSGHIHRDNVSRINGRNVITTLGFIVPQKSDNDHRFRVIELKNGRITKQNLLSII